jgi:hypothetical protein
VSRWLDAESNPDWDAYASERDEVPPLEDDRTAMMLGLVPDKRAPEERLWDAIRTNGGSLKYHYPEDAKRVAGKKRCLMDSWQCPAGHHPDACACDRYTFGDGLTRHRRLRSMALYVIEPIHRAVAEAEWQLTRLDTWLRDDQ